MLLRVLLLSAACVTAPAQVRITYLANEGVMLQAGDASILIDALFRDSLGDYQRHSAATQEKLETGRPPYHAVPLALATHWHLDHWDPSAIARFLRTNPNAQFASTAQGVAMLPAEVRARTRSLWPNGTLTLPHATIAALPLTHAPGVENLAFRVTLGHRTVVHLGDANPEPANFDALLPWGPVDVALVPFWWLSHNPAVSFLRDRWKAKHIVALHLGHRDAAESTPALRRTHPSAWICTTPEESRVF